ncbi:SDR family oxidoreductase [Prosthecochloris sp. HL-130-GSB]|jgi:dihydroflavonol-4-reductase|uniref:NAD-dependent epimerase/dehydratase family protein n=1 Tax=Prosthecochloris aestuarii TaxID=1102 RepID=A0A831SS53_PROAE|nr:SDR family oxidoreductase [Prosthecochloris sp. HL-130-GSB]ARM31271.1 epimerase [Prosthecochloris sp. HL-130-GSB]HED30827.1 NAD-dependent epimerase/dehydratase family protein [Prosthecochloris aestuarii]
MTSSPLACVTGATGFIASHLVRDLLEAGYRVRATVRNLTQPERFGFLREFDGAGQRLEIVEADLLKPGSFDTAIKGAQYVFHTASPYLVNVRDPQKDLVDPALEGTRTVLESCRKAGSVSRIVLTSSVAAITDDPPADRILSEKDWNTSSSLTRNPYHYSKTVAERAAWQFMEQEPGFELITVNPFMVIGPSLTPSLNTSNQIIRDIVTGVYPAIMDINWGFVDVRDVARSHRIAMETSHARGRYLCSAETLHMRDVVGILKDAGYAEGYRLPSLDLSGPLGTKLMKLASWTQPRDTGTYLRTHLGKTMRCDNSKIRKDLNMTFRDIRTSLLETAEDLILWKHLKKT